MKAIITVGLGFGDEGKGTIVDYLCRQYASSHPLVVRYCGGHQAGHNVVLPDGTHHTFSQFGAGTFAGALTYLGPNVIIDPLAMRTEASVLEAKGVSNPRYLLNVDPKCLVTTVYHIAINRLRELSRAITGIHGSCGVGVGVTREYWLKYGHDAITAADLYEDGRLIGKLELLRQRLLLEANNLKVDSHQGRQEYHKALDMLGVQVRSVVKGLIETCPVVSERSFPPESLVIFEGAQGVLLDENYGFHPNTTWSTVTTRHAFEMLDPDTEVCVLGITRAYATRHGPGFFPSESYAMYEDKYNTPDSWRGALRFGKLDLPLLKYAKAVCPVDCLAVTCLDQVSDEVEIHEKYSELAWSDLNNSLLTPLQRGVRRQIDFDLYPSATLTGKYTRDNLCNLLSGEIAPVVITSYGATHEDKTTVGEYPFRPLSESRLVI